MVGFYYHAAWMTFDHREPLGVAVVGVGARGGLYARALQDGRVPGARLVAVCDPEERALAAFTAPAVADARELRRLGRADAWIVASPPFDHPVSARLAFEAGCHLLLEKPVATTASEYRNLLDLHERLAPERVFATALPLREDARYLALGRLLAARAFGEPTRVSWTVTDCFRGDAYYRTRPWRAGAGGGGGVLLNQCLHQLDLLIRLFGMPARVTARVAIGRHHPIEVEDDVSAELELPHGVSCRFVASTGQPAGTNRLEIEATRGRAVVEGDLLEIVQNGARNRRTIAPGGSRPAATLEDFITAIGRRTEPSASAQDGLRSVELAEAIALSGEEGRTVDLEMPPHAAPTQLRAI
jgi:predicted dehydrogenase